MLKLQTHFANDLIFVSLLCDENHRGLLFIIVMTWNSILLYIAIGLSCDFSIQAFTQGQRVCSHPLECTPAPSPTPHHLAGLII